MSQQLISRSRDLKRLQDDGYDLRIVGGYLLVGDIPYLDANRCVQRGTLVSQLDLAGDETVRPSTHVAMFVGTMPCNAAGQPLTSIIIGTDRQILTSDVAIDFTFSSKPARGYADYHQKMTAYINILGGPARSVDPNATAATFPVVTADPGDDTVFCYVDTASSRAGIDRVTEKLRLNAVAIVGLGGTGSYVLDLIAKTPVGEIHLFDGDLFLQHNAFRSPGAPSVGDLARRDPKPTHYQRLYSQMRTGIVAHDYFIDSTNLDELASMDFVFITVDSGSIKRSIVRTLEAANIPFIDVGMGIVDVDDRLTGLLRVTTSTPAQRHHVHENRRIPFDGADTDDPYNRNIQIADLNALNAALAVVKWKKLCGFYLDLDGEHHALYQINGNTLINEDVA